MVKGAGQSSLELAIEVEDTAPRRGASFHSQGSGLRFHFSRRIALAVNVPLDISSCASSLRARLRAGMSRDAGDIFQFGGNSWRGPRGAGLP